MTSLPVRVESRPASPPVRPRFPRRAAGRLLRVPVLVLAIALALAAAAAAQGAPEVDRDSFAVRFDTAWRLVDERYWDLAARGVDWQRVRERFEPRALRATDEASFYAVLEEMYRELGDDHSVFVPPSEVARIRDAYGDLPCLGVFSQSPPPASDPGGSDSGGSDSGGSDAPGSVSSGPDPWDSGAAGEVADLQRDRNVGYRLLATPAGPPVGYLRVPDLATPGVAGAVRRAVRALAAAGAHALVLDLRGNPGGRLVEMMRVAGVFTGGLLWRTLTRWTLPLPYPALGATESELPLAVLVDGGVNSAAEGLAGALQQRGRATVIGERTAGNVEAVLPFCLRDGSQAWIATGVLAPIGGPTWEGRGVVPDIETTPAEALKRALDVLGEAP